MNKNIPVVAVAVLATALLGACGGASSSSSSDSDEPIKIAVIPPSTGALAQYGADEVKGWQLAVDEANKNGGVDGHPVELIIKKTDGQSSTTLQIAREVVTKDGAKFIGGVLTTPESSALNAQLTGLGALNFNSTATDESLSGKVCSANAFQIIQRDSMDVGAITASLKDLPGEKWAIQAVDYSTGKSAAANFKKAAEAAGKEVVLEQFAPLGITDFGPFISKLKSSGADALFAVEFGADGVGFVKQAEQFGLLDQLGTVVGYNMVSEPLFPALGDIVDGFYNNVGYDRADDNESNAKFVEAYKAKFNEEPYFVPANNYLAAQALFAGIEKAKSIDPDDVKKALSGLTFDSIVGETTIRAEDHQLLRPSYLGQVVKGDEGLAFKLLSTVTPDVTSPKANPDCSL